jgi:hypothetical protein
LKPLQRAYEAGLCAGDAESACWAIHYFTHLRYLVSFPLDLIIKDLEVYIPQMKELNQLVAYRSTLANFQMFMNLSGKTKTDLLSLTGDFCTTENHETWLKEDALYEHHCRLWQCYILTVYGEHEKCARLAIKYGWNTAVKSNPGAFSISLFEAISKGISSFVAARKTTGRSKKQIRKIALSIRKRVKDWIDKGNINVAHLDAFFDAEASLLNGRDFVAIKHYKVAIIKAARGGLMMDAGQFSEIFGEYLLENGDVEEATYRLKEAVKYYREFGAVRKVILIEQKYVGILAPPSTVIHGEVK